MWISQLQPHQCTRSSSLPCFWLCCCFAGRLHSPVLKKERLSLQSFSYWLPPMHKLGIFTWKTVGSSLLCITWKSYSFLCMLCFTEMCSAHYGHGNPHPMPPPASLAEKVVFHCTSTETSKVKERTPFPARFASEKKEQEKNGVMFCCAPAPAGFWIVILTEENRQKCYGCTCQHPDFFSRSAVFLSSLLCVWLQTPASVFLGILQHICLNFSVWYYQASASGIPVTSWL